MIPERNIAATIDRSEIWTYGTEDFEQGFKVIGQHKRLLIDTNNCISTNMIVVQTVH